MRLFVALDIPEEISVHISQFMDQGRALAKDARWARVEGLHVTLKFIGHVSDDRLPQIKQALASVTAAQFTVNFAGTGFFPHARAARVFWIGVDGGEALSQLASAVETKLEKLGIAREDKPYHPHLTLARAGARPLRELQPMADDARQFGTMTAREFFLYESKLQRGGSKYTRLERFALGQLNHG